MAAMSSACNSLPSHDKHARGRSSQPVPSPSWPHGSISPVAHRPIAFDNRSILTPVPRDTARRSRPPTPSPTSSSPERRAMPERISLRSRISRQGLKIKAKLSFTNLRGQPPTPPLCPVPTSPESGPIQCIREGQFGLANPPPTPSPTEPSVSPKVAESPLHARRKLSISSLSRRRRSSVAKSDISWPITPPVRIASEFPVGFPRIPRNFGTTIPPVDRGSSSSVKNEALTSESHRPKTARSSTAPDLGRETTHPERSLIPQSSAVFPQLQIAVERVRSQGPIIYGIPPAPPTPCEVPIATTAKSVSLGSSPKPPLRQSLTSN
jgi:hypothetical protein